VAASRSSSIIKTKYSAIFSFLGFVCSFAGVLLLVPLLTMLFYPAERWSISAFIIPSVFSLSAGLLLRLFFREKEPTGLTIRDGGVIVVLSWTYVCLISSIPFLIDAHLPPVKVLFESVSGWTTTGLSVIDVTETSRPLLLWRSILQLCGGGGLAIIMLSAIIGPYGVDLYAAEGHAEQLLPNVRSSARMVLSIYSAYTLLGIMAYLLAGMPLFEAINHSFCAVSTGGFSTVPDSIGHWNSITIEIVTIILMLLGATSFVTHYLLLRFKFTKILLNGEIQLSLFALAFAIPVLFYFACRMTYPNLNESLRAALFHAVSALSGTGYSTAELTNWPNVGIFVLILLMITGGGACSTAGGLKQYRIYLLIKSLAWSVRDYFLPKRAVVKNYVWRGENKNYIDDRHIRHVANFVFLYVATFAVGVLIFLAAGYSFRESLFEFASALGTVGLSMGITNSGTPSMILWTEIFGMFLGRLEFLVIFFGIVKVCRDMKTLLCIRKTEI
jgi:trk system potassium uptake protein TrkH